MTPPTATAARTLEEATGRPDGLLAPADWRRKTALIVETMREMSLQTDPQAMVHAYGTRIREFLPADGFLALSRRDLPAPQYRITRSSRWQDEVNPWTEPEKLPLLEGGILGELLYGDEPRIIDDLRVDADDPAHEYLREMRSLVALPNYDRGVALNMTIRLNQRPGAFDPERLPEQVWVSNLFGRATHNLVLSAELKKAYAIVERELKVVADIQRSLLPKAMPKIPTLDLAAHYQTSRWAGGDYYDFFPLPEGRWGILIADVSGHGTPAAVVMAITHSIAHAYPGFPDPPGEMLTYVNRELSTRYTADLETFVTAFYGVYDPKARTLTYASAGHNPPRLKRCADGTIHSLDAANGLPLGIDPDESYAQTTRQLVPGDEIVFYTDGITESTAPDDRTMYGLERLDEVLSRCHGDAPELIAEVLDSLARFTADRPADDDRTLLVAKVR